MTSWDSSALHLRDHSALPAAAALLPLLQAAEPVWGTLVVSRTSMMDLLFTNGGEPYPFPSDVRVAFADGVFEFRLHRAGLLVTADRCFVRNADVVLDSFLHQLLAERLAVQSDE